MWFLRCVIVNAVLVQVYSLNENLRGHSVIYGLASITENLKNGSVCYGELNEIYAAIDDGKVWGLKVMDASGEPGTSFIYGNNLWLGSSHECREISTRKSMQVSYDRVKRPEATSYDYPPFPLKFALFYMEHNNTLQYHAQMPLEFIVQLGLCVPASCNNSDLRNLLETYIESSFLTIQDSFHLNLEVTGVRTLGDGLSTLLLPKSFTFLSIVIILTFLVIIGTIYDVRKHNYEKNLLIGRQKPKNVKVSTIELVPGSQESLVENPSLLGEILKCFSIYSNAKALVKTSLSPDSITCIHGIRFLGMLWVCMVHSVFYEGDYLDNRATAYNLAEPFINQILSNSTYCVDTFLLLSGFLTGYLFLKVSNKISRNLGVKVANFFMMIINRFLRLTMPYVLVILFTNFLFTYYAETSPLLSSEKPDIQCDKYWWRNLLYINNLFNRSEMCLSWSWYLSLDMQLFIIAAFLLILSTVSFTTSAILSVGLIILNVITMTYTSYSVQYIPTMDEQLRTLDYIYDFPWLRCGPYIVGIITAYILSVKLEMKLNLSRRNKTILWCLFPALNIWILFSLYTRQLSLEYSAVYMGLSRTLWGVGIAWIIVACCTGNAQALQKFLSFRGFIPLSRLTYCAYLVNPLVINMIYLTSGTPYTASLAGLSVTMMGTTLITFYLAFFVSMMAESPFILLTKLFMAKMSKPRSRNANPTE